IALAPLALLYFEKTVRGEREGRPEIFYILIMAAVTWTNYYIAMLIDIFLVLYFFAVTAENFKGIKETLLSLIRFGVSSVLAAGLAAVLLIPEWAVIRGTSFSGNSLPDHIEFYMQIPTLILRSFPAVGIETGLGHEPGTYATVAVIMLLPLFFMNGRIRPVNKITRGLLILFFYFSFNTNILEFIWHGFNYPDSIPARQTFLLIILLISAGYEALEGMEDTGAVKAGIAVLFTALLYAVCLIFCRDDSHADIYTWILGAVFTALYAVIMILFVFFRTEYMKWGIYCFMMIVVFELAINLNITSPRDVSREGYFTDVMSYRKLAREAEKDDPLNLGCFTRFDTVDENIRNISCLSGYHDASYFSSTIDNGAEDFYKDFGMKASKVHYMGEGLTPFTSAIMGIGYVLADEYRNNQTDYDIATYIGEEGDDYLYKCLFALPFGYTVPEGYYGFDDDDRGVADPLDRQNKTAIKLGGDEIFHPVDSIYIEEDYGKAVITVPEDGHYYAWTEDDIDTIKEYTDFSEDEYGRFEDLRYDSIMDLGRLEKGGTVTLYTDEESEVEHLDIVLYRFEPNAMRALCEELSSGSFTLTGFKDDRIEALADIPSGRELVLAVPLSVGWTISLDGEQMMTPDEFYGLFIKLDIPEGIHHIELEYNIPLFGIGMTVSVVSLIIILLYILYPKIQVIMHR
nr:YfhO family protein [Lachnospiraceae bacterium]